MDWIITHRKFRTTGRSRTFFTAFILSRGGLELTYRPNPLPFSQNSSLHPGENSGRALKVDNAPEHPTGAGRRTGNFPREVQSSTSKPVSVPRIQEHMGVAHFSEIFPIYAPNRCRLISFFSHFSQEICRYSPCYCSGCKEGLNPGGLQKAGRVKRSRIIS